MICKWQLALSRQRFKSNVYEGILDLFYGLCEPRLESAHVIPNNPSSLASQSVLRPRESVDVNINKSWLLFKPVIFKRSQVAAVVEFCYVEENATRIPLSIETVRAEQVKVPL